MFDVILYLFYFLIRGNELKNEYYDIIDGIGKDIRDMDIKTLTERLKNKDMAKDFLLFFKARMGELERGRQFNTLNSYNIVYNHISGYKQEIPFRSLTPQLIDDLVARLKAKGCKNSSIKRYIAIIQSVFNIAIRKSVVSMPSPFKEVDIKPERPIKRALSIAKIRSIKDGVYSHSFTDRRRPDLKTFLVRKILLTLILN